MTEEKKPTPETARELNIEKHTDSTTFPDIDKAKPLFEEQEDKALDTSDSAISAKPATTQTNQVFTDSSSLLLTATRPWGPIEPIVTHPPAEPYPVDALPKVYKEPVLEVHYYTQASIPIAANSAIVCGASACQMHFDVARDDHLISPTSLFFETHAESGDRKTSCDNFFSKPLIQYQRQKAKDMEDEIASFKAEEQSWLAKVEGVEMALKQAVKKNQDTSGLESKLKQLHKNPPQKPRIPILVRTDDTPENLAFSLKYEWPSGSVIHAEAGLVYGSKAFSKESITRSLSMKNTLWDGGSFRVGRRSSESFTLEGGRLSIGLQVQPYIKEEFDRTSGYLSRHIGFDPRNLFSRPPSPQGTRFYRSPPKKMEAVDKLNQTITKILEMNPNIEDGILIPIVIPLSEAASEHWKKYHDKIEAQLGDGGRLRSIRDYGSKIADNAARLAANFGAITSISENLPFTEVGLEAMQSGCIIADWHLNEALRYHGNVTPKEKAIIQNAQEIERWVLEQVRKGSALPIKKQRIQQFIPKTHLRKKEALEPAIEFLAIRNRVRFTEDRLSLEINPLLMGSESTVEEV